ncbi:uncharacterized protein L203_104526 [Cryptococcus depauperatus CBS 7841]|uniref:Uncharacterized protein n=1 Tax=Cryptococcus depauperatus CBS 7841 TaxID=1295531 RepID=A0A1E3ILU8_9TREE|nr:hypothetical protein L203_02279 [Cryptococcus depauperatus CBS 7841]
MNPYGKSPAPNTSPTTANTSSASNAIAITLRPSYGMMNERERDHEGQNTLNKPYAYPSTSPMPSRPSEGTAPGASQRHTHHHHLASSAGSTPHNERTNPYASTPGSGNPPRKSEALGVGLGSGLGRLSGGYGLFGGSFREQEIRERERQEGVQRERERDVKLPAPTSPNQRAPIPTTATNPYPRPSLPPSPTNPATPRSYTAPKPAKPSISPQLPPANASGSNPRPNLPLPNFSTLGSRSLPSPFEHDARDRGSVGNGMPSPAVPSGETQSATVHNRTLSNSSAREHPPLPLAEKSPPKVPSAPHSARSLYASGPPPLGSNTTAGRERDAQKSSVTRAPTAVSPRNAISPTMSGAKTPNSGSGSVSAQPFARGPYSSSYTYPSNSAYAGSFGGFGLSGFGGYGAFGGPRWDHERERDVREARDIKETRDAREREKPIDEEQRRKEPAERNREQEKEGRDSQRWREQQRERERTDSARSIEFSRAANPASTASSTKQDPYRRTTTLNGGFSRHIEVLNQPDPAITAQSSLATVSIGSYDRENSVIQQVAPTREPRPYGYKPEPIREPVPLPPRESSGSSYVREPASREREYPYAREKRSRMDAVVEDAQVAHQAQQAQRRNTQAKSKRRKMEEERVHHYHHHHHRHHHHHHAQSPVETRDYAVLSQPPQKRIEVTSGPVEAWLKTLPSLSRIISTIPYTGKSFTLAKTGLTKSDNEGGIVIIRIGGGFLGKGWRVRGEPGWEESTPHPIGPICGAEDPKRPCWGTDVYTDDSDLGLILVHAGWLRWLSPLSIYGPKERNKDEQEFVNVTVRIVPRLVRYTGTERNGLKTRGWGNGHDGASIVVEYVERIKIDRKYLDSRKRKARIAEWAHERALVAPLRPSNPILDLSTDMRLMTTAPLSEPIILSIWSQIGKNPYLEKNDLWQSSSAMPKNASKEEMKEDMEEEVKDVREEENAEAKIVSIVTDMGMQEEALEKETDRETVQNGESAEKKNKDEDTEKKVKEMSIEGSDLAERQVMEVETEEKPGPKIVEEQLREANDIQVEQEAEKDVATGKEDIEMRDVEGMGTKTVDQ